jgi:hypothetical protein
MFNNCSGFEDVPSRGSFTRSTSRSLTIISHSHTLQSLKLSTYYPHSLSRLPFHFCQPRLDAKQATLTLSRYDEPKPCNNFIEYFACKISSLLDDEIQLPHHVTDMAKCCESLLLCRLEAMERGLRLLEMLEVMHCVRLCMLGCRGMCALYVYLRTES